jgi:ribosomal protein S15P/S13E
MKQTLGERLRDEIIRIDERCNQLRKHCSEYKEGNDFENAMKCQIKWRELTRVSKYLKYLLN